MILTNFQEGEMETKKFEKFETFETKLAVAKESLQSMISHWKKEWQDVVTKWSGRITIVNSKNGARFKSVVFLAYRGDPYRFFEYDHATQTPTSNNQEYCIDEAISCRDTLYYSIGFGNLPINLMIDVFRHFVLAFGLKFERLRKYSTETQYKNDWRQHLYFEEGGRHQEVINSALQNTTWPSTNNDTSIECDRWRIISGKLQLGGKIQPIHYIEGVLIARKSYQTTKMIDNYFQFRCAGTNGTSSIIKIATTFFKSLTYQPITGRITIGINGSYPYTLIDSILVPDAQSSDVARNEYDYVNENRRGLAKKFNLENGKCEPRTQYYWEKMMKNQSFLSLLGTNTSTSEKLVSLTMADVQFLLCLLIDAYYDHKETFEAVERISGTDQADPANSTYSTSRFPTADDNFSSFDPLLLRGLLAETVLSRKLAGYALGQEEISKGTFAAIAPSALTSIVASYYPVDVPHPSSPNRIVQ